ncbi:MAG TPA: hypothetical protein VEC16_03320, partial [Alphaproteobacteria bacterium]|nr:hypothetical protein [Alphaproteobacteria bacterium]
PKELSFYDTVEENFGVVEICLYYSAQSEAIYQRQKKKYEDNHLVCYEPKLVRVKKQDIKHLNNFPYQLEIDIYLAKDPKEHYREYDQAKISKIFTQVRKNQ